VLISRIEPIEMASDHLIDVDGFRKFQLAAHSRPIEQILGPISATSKLGIETLNKR
jgi:hypothetical protein